MKTYEEALDFVLVHEIAGMALKPEELLAVIYNIPLRHVALDLLANLAQEEYK